MKRDMDLAREILRRIEKCSEPQCLISQERFDGRSSAEVGYHVTLLAEAGLVEVTFAGESHLARSMRVAAAIDYWMHSKGNKLYARQTWSGHEFLDAARDDTLWNKAKTAVLSTTGGLTFDLLKAWLKQEAAQRLGVTL